MIGKTFATDLQSEKVAVGMIHPGFVFSEFGGIGGERREGERDVDVSAKGSCTPSTK
jgi:hypothetical protein